MPEILQDFPIKVEPRRVFDAVSTPAGLNAWWTETCSGEPRLGGDYALGFGPDYPWGARVTQCVPGKLFELTLTQADADWTGSRVAFELTPIPGGTAVRFSHRGWAAENAHYCTSAHCWALYLRILRRHLEHGESVPYALRLDA